MDFLNKGTTTEQDNRFSDKDKKLLKSMKFSPSLGTQVNDSQLFLFIQILISHFFKVDMTKIKLDVIKPWIQDKLTDMLKMDDDVIVNFVYNQLEVKVILFIFFNEDLGSN